MNVWVALLNLENSYGTEASLDAIFKEAAQSNDAKTIYLRLIDVYERSGKFEVRSFLIRSLGSTLTHRRLSIGGGGAIPEAGEEVRAEFESVDVVRSILSHSRETDGGSRSPASLTQVT